MQARFASQHDSMLGARAQPVRNIINMDVSFRDLDGWNFSCPYPVLKMEHHFETQTEIDPDRHIDIGRYLRSGLSDSVLFTNPHHHWKEY